MFQSAKLRIDISEISGNQFAELLYVFRIYLYSNVFPSSV